MKPLRILHVDDDPDIREVVEASLTLDPDFFVRSCGSGEEAIALVPHWSPDMILCDVMMPEMDGPATLTQLREYPKTADTPFIFMTARAQSREIEHFKSLGVTGVIAKPFDPMTLGDQVRRHLHAANWAKRGDAFNERLRSNGETLVTFRARLREDPHSTSALAELQTCAHKLAGAAGIFGRPEISQAAAAVEDSATERRLGWGVLGKVERDLDGLIGCISSALGSVDGEMANGPTS
jgi:CheY-like chemotaxis protein